jgi:DNA-damage-inducible protein J
MAAISKGTRPKRRSTKDTTVVAPSGTPAPNGAIMLHVRVSEALKADAAATLEKIGLTTSEAVRLFLHRVVTEQRLPLDLKVPNTATRTAIVEARAMAHRRSRFKTAGELFESLEKDD